MCFFWEILDIFPLQRHLDFFSLFCGKKGVNKRRLISRCIAQVQIKRTTHTTNGTSWSIPESRSTAWLKDMWRSPCALYKGRISSWIVCSKILSLLVGIWSQPNPSTLSISKAMERAVDEHCCKRSSLLKRLSPHSTPKGLLFLVIFKPVAIFLKKQYAELRRRKKKTGMEAILGFFPEQLENKHVYKRINFIYTVGKKKKVQHVLFYYLFYLFDLVLALLYEMFFSFSGNDGGSTKGETQGISSWSLQLYTFLVLLLNVFLLLLFISFLWDIEKKTFSPFFLGSKSKLDLRKENIPITQHIA